MKEAFVSNHRVRNTTLAGLLGIASIATATAIGGESVPTRESRRFLLIGTGPENQSGGRPGVGQAVNVNNYEIGANKAPVPSTGDFLTNGSSGGPTLLNNVPDVPLNAKPVEFGISGNGNIAVTHPFGVFNLQDVGVYGELGIFSAAPEELADDGTSDSFWNDPQQFPNTFNSTGFTNPGVNHNTGGQGVFISASDADQATRIEDGFGVTGGVNFTPLTSELGSARTALFSLAATGVLQTDDGIIENDRVVTLGSGLNVFDVLTGGNDFLVSGANLIINGPSDASAIFRIPRSSNMLISNGNILIGVGGIGLNNVLFVSDRLDNATHFSFSNAIVNGVAFWSLAASGGEIAISNSQGCTQLVSDKITLSNARFCGCPFVGPCFQDCPGDLNGDERVALGDLTVLLSNFGRASGANPNQGDLDCDGDVDLEDLGGLIARFGTTCL